MAIAAELLSRGYSQRDAGRMVGRSERTIRAWLHDVDGFRQATQAVQAEAGDPTALDKPRHALSATRKDGSPDWSIRVSAAKALLTAPPDAEPTFVQVVITADGKIVDGLLRGGSPNRRRLHHRDSQRDQRHIGSVSRRCQIATCRTREPSGCEDEVAAKEGGRLSRPALSRPIESGVVALMPGVQYCARIGKRKVHHVRRR